MTAATKYCNLLTLHWKMQVMGPLWQLRRVVQCESTLKIANSMQPLDSIFSLCIQGRANCTLTKPLGRSEICFRPRTVIHYPRTHPVLASLGWSTLGCADPINPSFPVDKVKISLE